MKYNFDQTINRKNTYSTQWDYIIDRFGTNDITPFSISDTDFLMPVEVIQAIQKASKLGIYGYTRWNHDDFKGSIIHYYKRRHQTEIQSDWIVYSPSVMYCLSQLMRLLTKPGDYVASFSPMYTDFEDCTLLADRKMIRVPFDEGNIINIRILEQALSQSKVLILCNPHNPTGKVFDPNELDLIIHLCKKYQVAIISDEIHCDIVYTKKHYPIMQWINEYENIYLVSSGSKTFNYPSLGGSFGIIPDEQIRNRYLNITKHLDFVNSANYMGITAIMTSYNECDDYIDELKQYLYLNMKMVEEYIETYCAPLHFTIPDGTYLAWIDCRELNVDCDILQKALIDIGKVGIMKGETYFGNHYLRMNIACPKDKLMIGLKGIKKAIDYLKKVD